MVWLPVDTVRSGTALAPETERPGTASVCALLDAAAGEEASAAGEAADALPAGGFSAAAAVAAEFWIVAGTKYSECVAPGREVRFGN